MGSDKTIKFIYDSGSLKGPKQLQNNVSVLYSPQRIKLRPGVFKHINMKLGVRMPEQIIAACVLLPTLSKNGLKLKSLQ